MGAGDVAYRMLLGLFGARVDCGDYAGDACFLEGFTDEVVDFTCVKVWKYGIVVVFYVFVQDFYCGGREIYFHYARAFFFGFAWDVVDCGSVGACYDVAACEVAQVADSASEVALEDEHVSGEVEFFALAKVCFI